MECLAAEPAWQIKKLKVTWSYFSGRPDPYIDITDTCQLSELRRRLCDLPPLGRPARQPAFTGGYMFSLPADKQHPAARWFTLYNGEITIATGGIREYFLDSKGAEKYIQSLFKLPGNQRTGNPLPSTGKY